MALLLDIATIVALVGVIHLGLRVYSTRAYPPYLVNLLVLQSHASLLMQMSEIVSPLDREYVSYRKKWDAALDTFQPRVNRFTMEELAVYTNLLTYAAFFKRLDSLQSAN